MTHRLICATPPAELAAAFGAANAAPDLAPDHNLAPRDLAPVITHPWRGRADEPGPGRVLVAARFGVLVPEPPWKAAKAGRRPGYRKEEEHGNARAERLTKDIFWSHLLRGRRCIVPAAGYYEWFAPYPTVPKHRQPYAVMAADGGMMALAGLFEGYTGSRFQGDTGRFVVVTVPCDDPQAAPTGRMPAILHGEREIAAWLGEVGADDDELLALLRPTPASALDRWRVCDAANEACNKTPEVAWRLVQG